MTPPRWLAAFAFCAFALGSGPRATPAAAGTALAPLPLPDAPYAPDGDLSIMTYNVKGLPFPVALGRSDALARIGHRLARLRQRGVQPHVVALQEAFTPDAKAIAALGGYAYVALGPRAQDGAADNQGAMPQAFRDAARWQKGETEGKWLDSGLVILSDYPIVRSARIAFPSDMCAGFDCLAAKGALVAWIAWPGAARPIAVADTHLNSRGASGVSRARADSAYARQMGFLHSFLTRRVKETTPLVFAGDFNIGHIPARVVAARQLETVFAGRPDATIAAQDAGWTTRSADLTAILARGKDRQFYRSGSDARLTLRALSVPFGRTGGADTLSDHIGFIAHYTLED